MNYERALEEKKKTLKVGDVVKYLEKYKSCWIILEPCDKEPYKLLDIYSHKIVGSFKTLEDIRTSPNVEFVLNSEHIDIIVK